MLLNSSIAKDFGVTAIPLSIGDLDMLERGKEPALGTGCWSGVGVTEAGTSEV